MHRWLALVLLVIGAALTARRRLTGEWARALLTVWVFGLVALRSYFADLLDLAAWADPRDVKRLTLTMFTFTVAMQVVRLLIEKSDSAGGLRGPRLFVQLGALIFLATGTQFEFGGDNIDVMREAAAYQFAGATALFVPLLLASLLRGQRWLPAPSYGLLVRAFVAGFGGAFVVQLLRIATFGPGGWSLAGHLGAVAVADAVKLACIGTLIVAWRAEGRVAASAVAIACALGFAAGYSQNLVVLMLDAAVKIVLLITVPSAAVNAMLSRLVAGYVRVRPALPAADHYHLFVASLLPAAVIGWGIAAGLRERRRAAAALAVVSGLALSLGFAGILYTHPLYTTESRQPIAFYVVLSDVNALAPLIPALVGLVIWLYLTVWRPARRAGPTVDPGASAAGARRWAALAAVAASALIVGAVGAGAAWRAASPMQAYVDPDGRFTIDFPRQWRVERRSGGDTVFYRDDPVHGVLVALHPGIPLPGPISAAQLVDYLARQIRIVYPDAHVTATASTPRVRQDRSTQRIEVTTTWTGEARKRLRSQGTITLLRTVHGSRFSYVTYQVPETPPRGLEAMLARVIGSYRAAD